MENIFLILGQRTFLEQDTESVNHEKRLINQTTFKFIIPFQWRHYNESVKIALTL